MIESLTHILNRLYSRVEAHLYPVRHKERKEIDYWQSRISEEGLLRNDHYLQTYTLPFDLKPSFYTGKRILDIGCGPRGSLEWADMATERVGLDPLVPAYLKMGPIDTK